MTTSLGTESLCPEAAGLCSPKQQGSVPLPIFRAGSLANFSYDKLCKLCLQFELTPS